MHITDGSYSPMNIVGFKMQLVEGLVGRWIDNQTGGQEEVVEHKEQDINV
jgi:hypothetical protein